MLKILQTKGRINRIEFALYTILTIILGLGIFLLMGVESDYFIFSIIILYFFYSLQSVKRYHDLNKWGVNGFAWIILPVINILFFLELLLKKGTDGYNKYGEPSEFKLRTKKNLSQVTIQPSIKEPENFENKLSKDKTNSETFESRYNYQDKNQVWINTWTKKDKDYCTKGDEIGVIEFKEGSKYFTETLYADKNGFLIIKNTKTKKSDNIAFDLFEISDDKNLYNIPIIEDDKFNKSENLKWDRIGGSNISEKRLRGFVLTLTENSERVFFTLNNIAGYDFIVLNYPKKDFDIKTGDKFQILLENDEIINLNFNQGSYQVFEMFDNNLRKIYENKTPISLSDLQKMAQFKIINWKLSFQTGQEITGIKPFGTIYHSYKSFEQTQEILQLLVIDYLTEIKNLKNYKPINSYIEENNIQKEICYVYLMIDTTNNFYKIGISNKPEYREKTLQSEKPTIELIISKDFPSRQIAESIEKALHNTFKDKHVRGEWFNLSTDDVDEIIKTLK